MGTKITQEGILKLLDKLYDQSVLGIEKVSPPIEVLANDYLKMNSSVNLAAKSFINYQIAKCTTSGFLTGLPGLITLPVTIPASIGSVLYVQMRMIACLAYMGGYDTKSDQVQTLVYACLAGISIDQAAKSVGIKIGVNFAKAAVQKIPGRSLSKINKAVGFKLLTKFGSKGTINIGKAVPIVGGIIGGGFDFFETKIIAKRAYKLFIEDDFSVLANDELEVIEVDEIAEDTNTFDD